MKFKGIPTAMAALALVTMPTLAVAAPVATPLTRPAAEKVDGDNAAAGGFIIPLLAVAAVVAGVVVVASEDDSPNSP